MKFLAISDLHADEELLDRLRLVSARMKYDAILFCGDLTNGGPVSYVREAISLFPKKAYAIYGNTDTKEVADELQRLGVLVHGKKVKLGEWNLVGLGGSNKTPFSTPMEFSEEELEATLQNAGLDEFSILLSHVPPYGIFDEVGKGIHVGSTAVRKMIEKKRPLMVICGHVHEHEGKDIIGSTLVVKLAPAESLRAAEIEIKDSIIVKFISL